MRSALLALAIALQLPLAAATAGERPRVAIVVTESTAPYEVARDALEEALSGRAELVTRTLDPDEKEVGVDALGADVLVPLGTRATSWCLSSGAGRGKGVPVVFAMVLNPVASHLVESLRRPGGRITGAALDIPVEQQLKTLRRFVGGNRIAVLYDPARTEALVQDAVQVSTRHGFQLVPIPVAGPTALEGALSRVDGSFDALWSVPDATVLGRGVVERVLLHTLEHRIPFMGLSEQYVRAGALVALAASYQENGRKAAELVIRVLAGEAAGSIPVSVPSEIEVVFNEKTARHLELEVPAFGGMPLRAVR